jgi:hypothetical protein
MGRFRVALSHDVQHKDKPMSDLSPLTANPDIEINFVEPKDSILPPPPLQIMMR